MANRDPYETLGVSRTASKDEIRKAYRKLARDHHPDLHPEDSRAEERFKEISRAWGVLSDDKKRKLYDEFGDVALESGFDPDAARARQSWARGGGFGFGGDPAGGFGGAGAGAGGFSDLFGDLFGGRMRASRGSDVEASMEVDLMDAIRGTEKAITVPQPDGSTQSLRVTIPKGIADGGRIRLAGKGGPGTGGQPPGDLFITIRVRPHPILKLRGRDLEMELPITIAEAIKGATIRVPTPTGDVSLRIPPGTNGGTRLRLRKKGMPGLRGAKPGDLFVRVEIHVPPLDGAEDAVEQLEKQYPGDVRKAVRF